MLRVFISHSSTDKDEARELYRRLSQDGYAPWLDEEDLLPGQNWRLEIDRALQDSHVVLVCLSPSAITRTGHFQKEIRRAVEIAENQPEDSIFIVPIRLTDCDVPEKLRVWHWLDLFRDNAYERLLLALETRVLYISATSSGRCNDDGVLPPSDPKVDKAIPDNKSYIDPIKQPPEETGGAKTGARTTRRIDGEYIVEGVNEEGRPYRGTATITRSQGLVFIVSRIARNTHICKGSLDGDLLAVDGDFRVAYRISNDGSLNGTWGEEDNGFETLTPVDHGMGSKGGLGSDRLSKI